MVKYVFVTGGVLSGLGKGITASSLPAEGEGLSCNDAEVRPIHKYGSRDNEPHTARRGFCYGRRDGNGS